VEWTRVSLTTVKDRGIFVEFFCDLLNLKNGCVLKLNWEVIFTEDNKIFTFAFSRELNHQLSRLKMADAVTPIKQRVCCLSEEERENNHMLRVHDNSFVNATERLSDELQQSYIYIDDLEEETQDLNNLVDRKTSEIDDLKEENQDLNNLVDRKTSEIDDLKEENQDLYNLVDRITSEMDTFWAWALFSEETCRVKELQSQLEQANIEVQALRTTSQKHADMVEVIAKQRDTYKSLVTQSPQGESGDAPGTPGRTVPPSPGYKKELETLQGKLDVKEENIGLLTTRIEDQNTELAASKETVAKLSAQLRDVTDEVGPLKALVQEWETRRDEWNVESQALRAEARRWQQKVNQLVERGPGVNDEDHRKVCQEKDALRELTAMRTENSMLRLSLQSSFSELDASMREVRALKSSLQAANELTNLRTQLTATNKLETATAELNGAELATAQTTPRKRPGQQGRAFTPEQREDIVKLFEATRDYKLIKSEKGASKSSVINFMKAHKKRKELERQKSIRGSGGNNSPTEENDANTSG